MKKFTILFFIVTLSMFGIISGCSDDDGGGGTTDPSINPEDYDYLVNVMSTDIRGNYQIMLMPVETTNLIGEVECTINGNTCSFIWYENYGWWSASYTMNAGETYNFDLTVDGTDYDADLTIVNQITDVSWPIAYDPLQEYEITWELASNSDYTLFQGVTEAYYNEIEELDPADRSFTIPAEWLGTTSQMYQFTIIQSNYAISGNLLLNSTDFVTEIYLTQ